MDPVAISTILNGYFGQWLKAHPKFPAWAVDASQLGIAIASYLLAVPPQWDNYDYWRSAILAAFASLGVSSVAGHSGVAPKTT